MKKIKKINVRELDSLISMLESGKSRVSIGDVREIRHIIDNLIRTREDIAIRYYKLAEKTLNRDKK